MKFIFADCLDYIDPGYDFISDSHTPGRKPYWSDQFPHEFLDKIPYDGILVSRAIVGDHIVTGKYTEAQSQRFRLHGARKFLRYGEKEYPGSLVFGDCGAFQYHKMENPPYSPEDMLDFYDDGMFTHGCSVDHIIFDYNPLYDDGLNVPDELKKRAEITLENAFNFIELSKPMKKYFKPIGVIQAWSPNSMGETALRLVKMGYDYIALGGMVPLNTWDIHSALQSVRSYIPYNVQVHILGFAKANYLHDFQRYNISSFDTTSPLIKAFKDEKQNFWALKNNKVHYYKAIKIPQVHANNKLKNLIRTGFFRQEDVITKEQRALKSIRAYSKGDHSLDETLTDIIEYARITLWDKKNNYEKNNQKISKLRNAYLPTLRDRPWEKCKCRVCRESGVEVVIFRSSNRNKRRGIHNLHIFREYLNSVMGKV